MRIQYHICLALLLLAIGCSRVLDKDLLNNPIYQREIQEERERQPYLDEVNHLNYEHLWAGEYLASSPLGDSHSLVLCPVLGYYYTCRCDIGPCGEGIGSVTYKNGLVLLSKEGAFFSSPSSDAELVVVKWGYRTYLIPEKSIPRFIESVKRGYEPRYCQWGTWLLRRNDWQYMTSGLPDLPAPYKALLYE